MAPPDVYGMTDRLSNEILDVIATRLELRGTHPTFVEMMEQYLDDMKIDEAARVLELGCGTGVAARAIARRPDFEGTVLGVDLSEYLIQTARRLATREGLDARISFEVGDCMNLDLPDASFDAVVAHTLISHVSNPHKVISEAARLVGKGGAVAIFDGDYASLTFGHPDPERGKWYDEAIQRALITQPRAMREMPRLLKAAGLHLETVFAHVLAEAGQADYFAPALESFRRLLPQSGVLDTEGANRWVDERLAESESGTFFGASNFYAYIASRS